MAFHLSFSIGEIEINFDSDIDPTPDVVDMFMRQMKQQALNAHVTYCVAMGEMESYDKAELDRILKAEPPEVEVPNIEDMLDE